METGILCKNIPKSRGLFRILKDRLFDEESFKFDNGIPSIKACKHKLIIIEIEIASFLCTWPCSMPFEKYSKQICNISPNKINIPILSPERIGMFSYKWGIKCNKLIDNK